MMDWVLIAFLAYFLSPLLLAALTLVFAPGERRFLSPTVIFAMAYAVAMTLAFALVSYGYRHRDIYTDWIMLNSVPQLITAFSFIFGFVLLCRQIGKTRPL